MIQRVILICVAASIGVVGCGGSDGGGGGGEAGEGGTGDAPGTGGGAGGGAGGGGDGGGGEGGAGGEVEPVFTSVVDRIDAGLVYRLEGCQCQDPDEAISESACLANVNFTELPLSDRQSTCIDEVTVGEEERTLENRFECLIEVDLAAASCLAMVSECSESAIADCTAARITAAGSCPTPQDSARDSFFECQATFVVEDAVDAFLDYRSAQCDCLTSCVSADPDPDVLECMLDTLQAEVDMLGAQGPAELKCINEFWRRKAVCFGNEVTCDGDTACLDLPSVPCGISGTILIDECLTPP